MLEIQQCDRPLNPPPCPRNLGENSISEGQRGGLFPENEKRTHKKASDPGGLEAGDLGLALEGFCAADDFEKNYFAFITSAFTFTRSALPGFLPLLVASVYSLKRM
jgi:hypothetical protein